MVLVSALQGCGPHHWSSNSGVVHARQTSWRPASNSRVMRMVLFSLSTTKSNNKLLFMIPVFLMLPITYPNYQIDFPKFSGTVPTIDLFPSSCQFQADNRFPVLFVPV